MVDVGKAILGHATLIEPFVSFNDQYLSYEQEIVSWTGIPKIASVPYTDLLNSEFVERQAAIFRERLEEFL